MRILFITDNFPPEVNAPATRTYEHILQWQKMGAEVTVITCAPNFPQGKVYDGYKNKLYQSEIIDGINVIRVWSYIARNEGFIKRILDYVSFSFTAFWAGLFKKTDIIIATSPQFFTTLTAFWLSIFKFKPWVFELRDLWPESIVAVGAMKKGFAIKMFEKLELFLYKRAVKIVSVTHSFKENLIRRGISQDKIEVVTNGANMEKFKPVPKNTELANKLGLEGKFVFGYIGTHGMAHGLDFILNCASEISDKNIHFLFIGDGAAKSELIAQKEKLNLKNVTFLDPVSKDEVAEYISITDAALVPLKKSDTFKTVIPSKIFESAAMGKPILLGVEGESKGIIDKYNAGLCFEPENKTDFLGKVTEITNNKENYTSFINGCAALAEDFDRKKLAENMYSIISECCNK